jgi:AAA domain
VVTVPVSYDTIAYQETLLLSERPYLPYGDVSLVYGPGSLGKGRMVMSFIADVTRGWPVGLDESADAPGDVVVILPEDKPGEQVRERLEAAGANLTRVFDLTRLDSGTRFKFSAKVGTPGDLPVLAAFIALLQRSCTCGAKFPDRPSMLAHAAGSQHAPRNPRLVVIDPITATIGEGTMQTNKGARAFVEPLQDLADATGVHVLLVAHPTKAGVLQGSGALADALRLVYRVERDDLNSDHRILRPVKANNLPPQLSGDLRFTILEDAQGRPRVVWLDRDATAKAGEDWRASRAAEKAAYVATAVTTAPPSPPSPGGKPWRVVRHDKSAAGAVMQGLVGDYASELEGRAAAAGAVGLPSLPWQPYSNAGGHGYLAVVRREGGAVSTFAVYDRTVVTASA